MQLERPAGALPQAPVFRLGGPGDPVSASLSAGEAQPQCQIMMNYSELASVPSDHLAPFTDQLRLAVAAYLARSRGPPASTPHPTCAATWPGAPSTAWTPLAARRPQLELYIRWMQEIRRFKPSTVSRRFSVTAGFYRTCVIDGLREHSPAEHVRRPSVPAESPTLGFTPAVRGPAHRCPAVCPIPATSRSWPCSGCSACGSSRSPARTSPTSVRSTVTGSYSISAQPAGTCRRIARCLRASPGSAGGGPVPRVRCCVRLEQARGSFVRLRRQWRMP
jgi:hypothetical protein